MTGHPAALHLGADDFVLADLEDTACELASLAGRELTTALRHSLLVRYTGSWPGRAPVQDPVSEVDHQVEALLRQLEPLKS